MLLIVLAILGGTIGWATSQLVAALMGRELPVPWTASATLGLLAFCIFVWALGIRPRIKGKPGIRPLDPFVAARTAALAMAASRTGAIVAGFYLGVAIALLADFGSSLARERLFPTAAAVVCALLVVLAALWLEYICRLPDDSDDDDRGKHTGRADDSAAGWVHPTHRQVGSPRGT